MLSGTSIPNLFLKCLAVVCTSCICLAESQNSWSNRDQLGSEGQTRDFNSKRTIRSGGWDSNIAIEIDGWNKHQSHSIHAIPVGEHVQVSRPLVIPIYKNIGVPLVQPVGIPVPHITAIAAPQPYPVHIPVLQPVAVPVIKTVATIVEKKVPYPIEKIIHVPIEKHVPVHIEKKIPVYVEKSHPIEIPDHDDIHHHHHEEHGWDR